MKLTSRKLGHLLVRLLVGSNRALIRLLETARFAHALHSRAPLRSFARKLTRSRAHGKAVFVYKTNTLIAYNSISLCSHSLSGWWYSQHRVFQSSRPSFFPSVLLSVRPSVRPSIHPSALRFYHQKRYFLITDINGKWVIQTHIRARARACNHVFARASLHLKC